MKIGILTFHFAHNIGAMLQAYALCSTLNKMGHDCEIIDYRHRCLYDFVVEPYTFQSYYHRGRRLGLSKFKSAYQTLRCARGLLKKQDCSELWHQFYDFMCHNLKLSKRVNERNITRVKYDAIITGSDQVWNLELTDYDYQIYYLGFTAKKNYKRIAYAASTGYSGFPFDNNKVEKIKEYLKGYDMISCREEALSKTVSEIIGKDVPTVCDPVYLLPKAHWEALAGEERIIKEDYILLQDFYEDDKIYSIAKLLAKKLGLSIVWSSLAPCPNIEDVNVINCQASPKAMLNLIHYSSTVVTNSFHCLSLSIIQNKDLYAVVPPMRRERIDNIVKLYNLKSRYIDNVGEFDFAPIDFKFINKVIDIQKNTGIQFLNKV